jgi:hypothetical protein
VLNQDQHPVVLDCPPNELWSDETQSLQEKDNAYPLVVADLLSFNIDTVWTYTRATSGTLSFNIDSVALKHVRSNAGVSKVNSCLVS